MEGRDARRGLSRDGSERILLNCSEGGRLVAGHLRHHLATAGFDCVLDEIVSDPGERPLPATLQRLDECAILVTVMGRRCSYGVWRDVLIGHAKSIGIPTVVFFEGREQEWQGGSVPSLVTADAGDMLRFMARSRPDPTSVWEFAREFFLDRATARQFRREARDRWRWRRQVSSNPDGDDFELSLADTTQSRSPTTGITMVEARSEAGMPVVLMGTSDFKRYRFAYSIDIRGVLPAPVWPGIEPIGFMHCDFDTAREWPRAGSPPVEMRLLGLEVYGWHMSEYFWRAFVGSLPKILGREATSSTPLN